MIGLDAWQLVKLLYRSAHHWIYSWVYLAETALTLCIKNHIDTLTASPE
jgi:hypothetical protein